jgi:hypothetical protein
LKVSIRLLTDWQAKPELEPEPPKNSPRKQGKEEQEKSEGIGMSSEEEEEEHLMEPLEET